jgi:hypothetical protein
MSPTSSSCVTSHDVLGKIVLDRSKSKLGKIEEIVLDKVSGQTKYIVLSFGGVLGLGNEFFAFPWKAFKYSKEDESFILNIDKHQLKAEQGFNKDNWPDMAGWPQTIDTQYVGW